jgi:cytochrome c oxidase subunit II
LTAPTRGVDRTRTTLYEKEGGMQVTLPHDASLHGHRVDAVLRYLTISTGLAFAVMAGILLIAVLFHRGRNRQAHYTHGHAGRDRMVAVIAGAAVLFGIDAVAVVRSAGQLRSGFWHYPDADPQAVRVEVTAQQWVWTFRYPGGDGRFNTPDDIVTLNELRVPVGRPVVLQLTSKDVVHSLYLPNFRTKIDAIPGATTRMWFEAKETGLFEIGCAQHCGAWHYKMRGELTVMDADAFVGWSRRAAAESALRSQPPGPGAPTGMGTTASPPDGWTWKLTP